MTVSGEEALSAGHTLPLVPSSEGGLWLLPSLALPSPSSLVAFPLYFLCDFAWKTIPDISEGSYLSFPILLWMDLLPWRNPAVTSYWQGIWTAVSGRVAGCVVSATC